MYNGPINDKLAMELSMNCRLCLKNCENQDGVDLLNDKILPNLMEVFPNFNNELLKNPKICNDCILNLDVTYNFQQGVVENENKILEESKKDGTNQFVDLNVFLDDQTKEEIKEYHSVCRLCLSLCLKNSTCLYETIGNPLPYSCLKKMVDEAFQIDLTKSEKPLICDECFETLQSTHNFRRSCLKVEKKIKSYCTIKQTLSITEEEFKNLANIADDDSNSEDDGEEEIENHFEQQIEPVSLQLKTVNELGLQKDEPDFDLLKDLEGTPDVEMKIEIEQETLNLEDACEEADEKRSSSKTPHAPKVYFRCTVCSYETSHKMAIKKHKSGHKLSSHDKIYECPRCPFKSTHRTPLAKHLLKHRSNLSTFKCITCVYKTTCSKYLKRHVSIHKKGEHFYRCEYCDYKTKSKTLSLEHKERYHPNEEGDQYSKTVYKCTLCPYKTKYMNIFQHHKDEHINSGTGKFYCNMCRYKTKFRNVFENHLRQHEQNPVQIFECQFCRYKTKYENIFERHKKEHQNEELPVTYNCPDCSYKTKYQHVFEKHRLEHSSEPQIAKYKCTQCTYKTNYKLVFENHMIDHKNGEEPVSYDCKHCGYNTNDKQEFKQHWEEQHSCSSAKYECFDCTYKTNYVDAFNKHREDHRRGATPNRFSCNFCNYKTNYQHIYEKHVEEHLMYASPKQFNCKYCDFKTDSRAEFNTHFYGKHAQAKFACDKCSYKTNYSEMFDKHRLDHNSVPSAVQGCNYESGFEKHGQKRQSNNIEVRPVIECDHCPYKTRDKEVFEKHKTQHLEYFDQKNKLSCQSCSFKTDYLEILRKHEKTHAV